MGQQKSPFGNGDHIQKKDTDSEVKVKYALEDTGSRLGYEFIDDVSDIDAKVSQFYNDVTREYKQLCEEKKNDPEFMAFKNMFDTLILVTDYQSGDFLSAMADNPYLRPLCIQDGSQPKFGIISLSELKEGLEASPSADKEAKGPLKMLDEYFRCTNELFKREYEKQKLVKEGYTPEQEKEYLKNLKRDMTATVKNFDELYSFSEKYGNKYKAGGLLNNDLDHITDVEGKNTRGVGYAIGHIKGQICAIENGWGMEELVPLGALGELKQRLETNVRKGDYSINIADAKINSDLGRIEKAKKEKNEKMEKAVQNLKIRAKDYEDYKLSDHT